MTKYEVKNDDEELTEEIIAKSIVTVADGAERLFRSKLNRKAIFLLIQHACPSSDRPPIKTIETIFVATQALKKTYLK